MPKLPDRRVVRDEYDTDTTIALISAWSALRGEVREWQRCAAPSAPVLARRMARHARTLAATFGRPIRRAEG